MEKSQPLKNDGLSLFNRRLAFRNQILTLLKVIDEQGSWLGANSLTKQACIIQDETKKLFPEEEVIPFCMDLNTQHIYINISIGKNDMNAVQRVVEIDMALKILLNFYDTKIGDPVSQEFVDNYLSEASEVIFDEDQKHNALIAAVFIRISLEQTIKTLCRKNGIAYRSSDRANYLNTQLKNVKVYRDDVSTELEAKLKLLNAVIHNDYDPPISEIKNAMEWANRFTSRYLPTVQE